MKKRHSFVILILVWTLMLHAGCATTTKEATLLSNRAVTRGGKLLERGERELARAQFLLAVEYNRQNALAWNALGVMALQQQDLTGAEAYLSQAILLNERLVEAQANLGVLMLARYKPQKAITYLKSALYLHPGFARARFNLGLAHLALAQNRQARRAFAIVASQPGAPEIYIVHFAYALALTGESLSAARELRRLPKESRHPALVEVVRGVALMHLSRYKEARAHLLRALSMAPGHREARFHLALCYARQQQLHKAAALLKSLLATSRHSSALPGVRLAYATIMKKIEGKVRGERR